MLKLGVYRVDQYPRPAVRGPLAWLHRGRVAYSLLATSDPPTTREIEVFEWIMLHLRLTGGVYRTTSPGRFRDLDLWFNTVLKTRFRGQEVIEVQDWAASAGITSAAWHEVLHEAFPGVRLTASDLNLFLIEMQVAGQGSYIFEAGGGALQFIAPPFVIRLDQPEPLSLPVNRMLARRARARLEALRREHGIDPAAVEFPAGAEQVRQGPLVFRKIPLIHPRAAALARSAASFRVERHSVFEPAGRPAHVVRTMNILNAGYFDSTQLQRGARSVWESLVPGGLWIVGRTVKDAPPLHHVSVLVKTGTGFELLERYNQKSEIEDLARAVRA